MRGKDKRIALKVLGVIISLFCILLMDPIIASAESAQNILSIDMIPGKVGEEVTVSMRATAGLDVAMMQFSVRYDAERLDLISANVGEAMHGLAAMTINTGIVGKVYVSWDTIADPLIDEGSVIEMKFRIKEEACGVAEIALDTEEEFIFARKDYSLLVIHPIDGGVVIEEDTILPVLGDVDCDGDVDGMDVSLLKKYLLNRSEITERGRLNADVNGDGAISGLDASSLSKYLLGGSF